MRIAYSFDYDHSHGHRAVDHAKGAVAAVRRWMSDGDRRSQPRRALRPESWRADAYDACDRVRSLAGLQREPGAAA